MSFEQSRSTDEVEDGEVRSSDEGGKVRRKGKQGYCGFVEKEGARAALFFTLPYEYSSC